jgi:signal transduction histidine kinase
VGIFATVVLFIYYSYIRSQPTPPGYYLNWFWSFFYFELKHEVMGVLLLVPILYSTITLGWKHSLIILLILLACITPYIFVFAFDSTVLFVSFGSLIIPPTLIIAGEIKLISDEKERMAQAEKKRERAEFLRQTFSVQEDERKRISLELHDGIAQTLLVNASLAYAMLEKKNKNIHYEMEKNDLEAIQKSSLNMVAEIRCICQDLRPSILDNLGLVDAIQWLIDNFQEETGIDVEFSLAGTVYQLSQDQSVAIFRMVQEAFNNIKKHAQANVVYFLICFSELNIALKIKDNGKGFQITENINQLAANGKLGILGMNERAQSIGANLKIQSAIGVGTEVHISIQRNSTEGPLTDSPEFIELKT